MKAILITCLLYMSSTLLVSAQDTLYLSDQNKVVKKRKQAESFKVSAKTDSGYVVEILDKALSVKSRSVYSDRELKILDGYFVEYAGDKVYTEGYFRGGKKDGPWNYFYQGNRTAAVNYKSDEISTATYYKTDGTLETDRSKIERLPSFYGGTNGISEYLSRSIRYPKEASAKKISGTVLLEFTVLPNGQVADVDVINRVSLELDIEAARVVKQMPLWSPGVQFGRPVKVRYRLPVAFRI